jgi:hypothetical protein
MTLSTMNTLAQAVDFNLRPHEGIALLGILIDANTENNPTVDSYELAYSQRYNYTQDYHIFHETDLLVNISYGSSHYEAQDVDNLERYLNTYKPDLFKQYKKEYYLKEKEEDTEASFVKEEFTQPILQTLINSDTWFITLAKYQLKKDRVGFTQYIYDENIIGRLIESSRIEAIDYLISEGFDLNHVNKEGLYPIFKIKNVDTFEYLKDKNIDWDVVGAKKKTIISFVSRIKDANVSRVLFNRIVKLLKNGVEEQVVNGIIENFAQSKTQSEIFNSLKKYKKPLAELRDEDDNNLFLIALRYNNVRVSAKLLQEKLDFEHVNVNGEKALDFALSLGGYRHGDSDLKKQVLNKIMTAQNPFSNDFAESVYLKNLLGKVRGYGLPFDQISAKMKELGIEHETNFKTSYNDDNWVAIMAYFERIAPINHGIVDKIVALFKEGVIENISYQFFSNNFSSVLFNRFYDKEKMDYILECLVEHVTNKAKEHHYNYSERFLHFCDKVGFEKLPGRLASQIDIENINGSKKEYYQTQLEKRRIEDMVVIQDKVVKRRKI